jgi:uncharacterized protein YjgD (DUF1641 family)
MKIILTREQLEPIFNEYTECVIDFEGNFEGKIGYHFENSQEVERNKMNKEEIKDKIKEKLNTKSVEELLPVMGDSYKEMSVQVAFKEGYNKAMKIASTLIQESNREAVEGLVGWTQLNTLVSVRDVERLRELVKEYLSSIGKEER